MFIVCILINKCLLYKHRHNLLYLFVHMLVYNKHLMKGVFVSVCLLRPQQTGQRIVA